MKLSLFVLTIVASVIAHEGHDHGDDAQDLGKDTTAPASEAEKKEISPPNYSKSSVSGPFVEQFNPDTLTRWIKSEAKKIVDGVEDEDLLRYRGEWAFETPSVWPGIKDDAALVVKTAAAHHAISAKFDTPVDPAGKTLVVQYEVKFQKNHDCGGAYIKLLTYDPTFEANQFGDQTPYTIMFGPDKCGMNNKVHFIFRHQNPITKVWEEKHMNSPPAGKIEKKSGLYTLIVDPDNTFELLINNQSVKKGSLLEDFTPSVNPPKKISDPDDKKPEDWVDDEKIADASAVKPEDWDEKAPLEIPDTEASQPEDWLENEPLTVADPEAVKPEDWDDEEDGEWTAPTVPNPKCEEVSGCGVWKRPTKRNPDYKGKWKVPMVDNPDYKGVWAAKKIDNPDYFEDDHPADFTKIGAIGIELWTMSDGITFDNVYIGYNVEDAKKTRNRTMASQVRCRNPLRS